MKMNEKEKGMIGLFRMLESEKSRDDLIFQAETMVRAQDAMKADYGLVGKDAPLFNGAGAVPGPSDPAYAMSRPSPRMGEALAHEALNG